MPVELRKRKTAPASAPAPPPAKKKATNTKAGAKAKEKGNDTAAATNGAPAPAAKKTAPTKVAVGDVIDLEGFGGEIETQDGEKTTLKKLVDESDQGVVLFTYPKASTPGCTTQACLFRDAFTELTATGLSIFGLSTDSPKANTTFKTKQNLPYTLLCDPQATLIKAIGFKKAPKGTTRGVFVIDKQGKILAAQPGGPAPTVEVVRKLVGGDKADELAEKATEMEKEEKEGGDGGADDDDEKMDDEEEKEPASAEAKEDKKQADVAADVADSAAKLDE
ncbi:MAG: folylpolyglutamate synthase [Watsoniomyces obsoletus]|nr:MAG: folylpolyglutamate synthase [Watsoniomyces obsoletus]